MLRAECVIKVSGVQTRSWPSRKCRENSAYRVVMLSIAALKLGVSSPDNCTNWRKNFVLSLNFFLRLNE